MFRDGKNLKDTSLPLPSLPRASGEETGGGMPYSKTNKLITALYMVTDIVDREEPLRNKLRTLGASIISDTHNLKRQEKLARTVLASRIEEIMSFLSIARALNIISAMNCDILEKEFYQLDHSIKELAGETKVTSAPVDLGEFFKSSEAELDPYPASPLIRGRSKEGVFPGSTRLGVQKGGTLMKALSDRNFVPVKSIPNEKHPSELKGQRRNDILNIIKINGGNATIKDIKDKILTMSDKNNPLVAVGEKTLQRELISMVANGVLKKEGEKRWSRYCIA